MYNIVKPALSYYCIYCSPASVEPTVAACILLPPPDFGVVGDCDCTVGDCGSTVGDCGSTVVCGSTVMRKRRRKETDRLQMWM